MVPGKTWNRRLALPAARRWRWAARVRRASNQPARRPLRMFWRGNSPSLTPDPQCSRCSGILDHGDLIGLMTRAGRKTGSRPATRWDLGGRADFHLLRFMAGRRCPSPPTISSFLAADLDPQLPAYSIFSLQNALRHQGKAGNVLSNPRGRRRFLRFGHPAPYF